MTPPRTLPKGLLVAWYGDDFTGSAAVMEVLSFAGLPSVLFLDVPTLEQREKFAGIRGLGIAGTARSQTPDWMAKQLPPVFSYLKSLDAPITHYKICSTLDSSPRIGSIGKAVDIAQPILHSPWIPFYVAAPPMRRYQCFGHLFAAAPGGVCRLDRHPVMARHPVTPMNEADVARHISLQTNRKTSVLDVEMLGSGRLPKSISGHDGGIVMMDTVSLTDMRQVGKLIWGTRGDGVFAVGAQGVEYALIAHWVEAGILTAAPPTESAGAVDRMVVVSGSVSEVTASQITWAQQNGFDAVRLDIQALLSGGNNRQQETDRAVSAALQIIENGQDPLIFSASGPDDPAIACFNTAIENAAIPAEQANHLIGETLGIILKRVLRKSGVRRAVISGGDTSGHATRQLGIYALTALAPTTPGAALFEAHSDHPDFQGLQLALKGGQMGTTDYFGWIKNGGGAAGKKG